MTTKEHLSRKHALTIPQRKEVFEKKKVVRVIYEGWYKRIRAGMLRGGRTVEIGSGFGDLKRVFPDCVVTDLEGSGYVDVVLDARQLPFREGSISNIICIDALHHFSRLDDFFAEAGRALVRGGRLIIVDMYVSMFSYPILKFLHFEDMEAISLVTRMFFRNKKAAGRVFEDFKVISAEPHDLLVYPLSGGFGYRSFVPLSLLPFFQGLENRLAFLRRFAAFKTTVVLERT